MVGGHLTLYLGTMERALADASRFFETCLRTLALTWGRCAAPHLYSAFTLAFYICPCIQHSHLYVARAFCILTLPMAPGALVPGAWGIGAWGIGAWGLDIGWAGEARPCNLSALHLLSELQLMPMHFTDTFGFCISHSHLHVARVAGIFF